MNYWVELGLSEADFNYLCSMSGILCGFLFACLVLFYVSKL